MGERIREVGIVHHPGRAHSDQHTARAQFWSHSRQHAPGRVYIPDHQQDAIERTAELLHTSAADRDDVLTLVEQNIASRVLHRRAQHIHRDHRPRTQVRGDNGENSASGPNVGHSRAGQRLVQQGLDGKLRRGMLPP